jgi:hypothetical protein
MIGAAIVLPSRTPSFDDLLRQDVARQRGLDHLAADTPPDVRLRARAAALKGNVYVPPREFARGRRPRPSSPALDLRGVAQTITHNPVRRTL